MAVCRAKAALRILIGGREPEPSTVNFSVLTEIAPSNRDISAINSNGMCISVTIHHRIHTKMVPGGSVSVETARETSWQTQWYTEAMPKRK